MVARQGFFQRAQHLAAVLGVIHVDEVDDDDAAQVAQPQLPRHRLRRLQVGAEHGFFQVALADEGTGVHIDGGHRLGLVDHQITTGLERHLLVQRTDDFILHAKHVEDRAVAGVQLQLLVQHRHVLGDEGLELEEGLLGVHLHLVHVLADQVAHRTQRQAQVFIDDAARRRFTAPALDHVPHARQIGDVFRQRFGRLAFGVGAHDVAVAAMLGRYLGDQRLEPGAFGLVLDARRHTHHLRLRQQHQVTRGDADLRGQPCTLGADRVLDHLHHHVLPIAQQLDDRHRRRQRQRGCGFIDVRCHRRRSHHVVGVQERRALQPHFDERGLHARHHPLHLALVDVADHATAPTALDVQLLQHAVFDHRHACFARGDIHQNFFGHALHSPLSMELLAAPAVNADNNAAVCCNGSPITPE
ncbi:hypothetical protein D3C81_811770 [compost metagenome]